MSSDQILKREGSMARAQAKDLSRKSVRVDGLIFKNKDLRKIWCNFVGSEAFWNGGDLLKQSLGKPLVTLPEYRSSPGLWVFDDAPTGIVFLVFSDCHHKNAWKGTSYELIVSSEQEAVVHEAFGRLLQNLYPGMPSPSSSYPLLSSVLKTAKKTVKSFSRS